METQQSCSGSTVSSGTCTKRMLFHTPFSTYRIKCSTSLRAADDHVRVLCSLFRCARPSCTSCLVLDYVQYLPLTHSLGSRILLTQIIVGTAQRHLSMLFHLRVDCVSRPLISMAWSNHNEHSDKHLRRKFLFSVRSVRKNADSCGFEHVLERVRPCSF